MSDILSRPQGVIRHDHVAVNPFAIYVENAPNEPQYDARNEDIL